MPPSAPAAQTPSNASRRSAMKARIGRKKTLPRQATAGAGYSAGSNERAAVDRADTIQGHCGADEERLTTKARRHEDGIRRNNVGGGRKRRARDRGCDV